MHLTNPPFYAIIHPLWANIEKMNPVNGGTIGATIAAHVPRHEIAKTVKSNFLQKSPKVYAFVVSNVQIAITTRAVPPLPRPANSASHSMSKIRMVSGGIIMAATVIRGAAVQKNELAHFAMNPLSQAAIPILVTVPALADPVPAPSMAQVAPPGKVGAPRQPMDIF